MNSERTMRSAREAVVAALEPAAGRMDDMPISGVNIESLSPADARLAIAIHRTVLQRWLTLEHLLNLFLKRPVAKLEPAMQAVLLTGAAQLVFMHRLPAYAVVSETVSLGRRLVRPQAAGMINAVLRKVASLVENAIPDQPWHPAPDRLPLDDGSIALAQPCLPPVGRLVEHLAVATSHPTRVIQHWLEQHGPQETARLAAHSTLNPPTVTWPGGAVWDDGHRELIQWLAQDPTRRVQDPAATRAVEATRVLPDVKVVYDACAGKGTKTRQLHDVHRSATIYASDPDAGRSRQLADVVRQLDRAELGPPRQGEADLLVLDVPCSNTGVLARRPEARYRFSQRTQRDLVSLQRRIAEEHLPTLAPKGCLLYTTCSIDRAENQEQAQWMARLLGGSITQEQLILPSPPGQPYHDGSYHALIAR